MKKEENDDIHLVVTKKNLEEAGKESFPASDPLAWTLGSDPIVHFSKNGMKHDLTQMLAYEHHLIKKILKHIHVLIKHAKNNHKISHEEFDHLVEFFEIFVANHHKKEELLFPLLKHGRRRLSDYLLNDLKTEHEHAKTMLLKLKTTYSHYLHQKENVEFIKTLKDFHDLHLNHSAKEDEYVLPAINKLIDTKQQKEILLKFVELNQKMGAKEYEHLVKLAESE